MSWWTPRISQVWPAGVFREMPLCHVNPSLELLLCRLNSGSRRTCFVDIVFADNLNCTKSWTQRLIRFGRRHPCSRARLWSWDATCTLQDILCVSMEYGARDGGPLRLGPRASARPRGHHAQGSLTIFGILAKMQSQSADTKDIMQLPKPLWPMKSRTW